MNSTKKEENFIIFWTEVQTGATGHGEPITYSLAKTRVDWLNKEHAGQIIHEIKEVESDDLQIQRTN